MKRLYLSSIIFLIILISFGTWNVFANGKSVIKGVMSKPNSVHEFANGEVFRNIELLFTENFINRQKLIGIANKIDQLKGKSESIQIIDTTGVNVADDWQDKETKTEELINQTEFGSILIVDNKAMEINIYNQKAIDLYAKTLNKACEKIDPKVEVYSLIVPTQIEYTDRKDYQEISYSQRDSITELYSKYNKVVGVDVYDILKEHSKEYIYFRTDHHWTQLGAYYAYTEFIKEFNDIPENLEDMNYFEIDNYLGSLYRVTNSAKLINNKDVIQVYVPSIKSNLYLGKDKNNTKGATIDKKYATEDNKYGLFLGGDEPIIYIESEVDNDRSIVVIKDSYANAFIPFLTNHFKRIYVIDPRLWDGSLYDLIKEKKIDNVLFLNYCLINRYEGYSDIVNKILF